MAWNVVVEPEGKNPGESGTNEGGMVIYLVPGDRGFGSYRQEISRVAWIRRNSKNPDVTFGDQLQAEIERAQKARDTINDLVPDESAGLT